MPGCDVERSGGWSRRSMGDNLAERYRSEGLMLSVFGDLEIHVLDPRGASSCCGRLSWPISAYFSQEGPGYENGKQCNRALLI